MERSSTELRTGPAGARTGSGPFTDFVLGQPAPRTLYTVLDVDTGEEHEVTDKPPERGHVLVVAGDQVLTHHLDRMARAGQPDAEDQAAALAREAPGAGVMAARAAAGQAADKDQAEAEATQNAIDHAKATGVDLSKVQGTGAGGKITKADVEKAATEQGKS
jgi:pyruvate/2-oxoglutarate dehydrogenase complex dihydrolipoamide acyltransferase (E2) component